MQSLAVKYRPATFEDIVGQESIVKILKKQVEEDKIRNVYLFCGASGCGKTTASRAFASMINNGQGSPIEIDAASNNGVDNVRDIVASAQERAIDSKYKVYILDECHVFSNSAWNAFLKCIEEPPTYTIFIFCTTDPQKIPATILNRVQRFNFTRIKSGLIEKRLRYVCEKEGFTNFDAGVEYISKISGGCMRDALTNLDKCCALSTDITVENVLYALGNFSYECMFKIVNHVIDGKEAEVLQDISDVYDSGADLKIFIDQFLSFCLDITKYILTKDCSILTIPSSYEEELKKTINFKDADKYYAYIIDNLIQLKNDIKNDMNLKDTVEIRFLKLARCS